MGDGKINVMRKIKEMSGNNAMLRRREEGGEANSGYSPTQDGSCPGEQAKEEHTVYFPIRTNTFKERHFRIQTKKKARGTDTEGTFSYLRYRKSLPCSMSN